MQNRMQMQKKTMQAQAKLLASNQSPGVLPSELASDAQIVRNIKASEWHQSMSDAEFRIYVKDCLDYKKITKYSDKQIIIQMRLSINVDLNVQLILIMVKYVIVYIIMQQFTMKNWII